MKEIPFWLDFFVIILFQTESISIFYIYFVIKMICFSEILCIFAQNLGNVIEKSR